MFAVARLFSKWTNGKTVCKILNYNPNALVVRKGIRVATIDQAQNIVSCVQYNEIDSQGTCQQTDKLTADVLDKFLSDYGFAINPNLSSEQKYELLQLLSLHVPWMKLNNTLIMS